MRALLPTSDATPAQKVSSAAFHTTQSAFRVSAYRSHRMTGTPNTLGVVLLFLVVFLGCILWATSGYNRRGRPRRGRRRQARQIFLTRYAAGCFFGRNALITSDSPKQISRHRT